MLSAVIRNLLYLAIAQYQMIQWHCMLIPLSPCIHPGISRDNPPASQAALFLNYPPL